MQFSIRRNLAWMGGSQIFLFIIQFGGSIVMARLLTPYEMGVYAVAAAVISVLGTIRNLGLGSFIIREPELTAQSKATIFTVNALLAVILSVLIVGLAAVGGRVLGDPGVSHVMMLLFVVPLLGALDFIPNAYLERAGSFAVIAAINVARSVMTVLVAITLAYHGYSYMSIAWGTVASAAVNMMCVNIIGWRHVSFQIGFEDWSRVARFGIKMLVISSIGNIAARLTELLLGRLVSISALGLYSRASGLHSLLWDNIHIVIGRIVFVDFAERQRKGLSLRESYLKIVAMTTGLLWPAFAGTAILSGPVIYNIYGDIWLDAAFPLSLLSISGLVLTAITMTSEIYVISGQSGQQLRFEVKRVISGLILFTLGCLGGLNWAAGSRILDAGAMVLFVKSDLENMTQTRSADYPSIYLQSFGLTIAACAPATLLMVFYQWSAHTPLLLVLPAVVIGALAWLVLLSWFRHPLFDEVAVLSRYLLGILSRTKS